MGYFVQMRLVRLVPLLPNKTPQRERLSILFLLLYGGLYDELVTLLAPVNHRSCDILLANWRTGNGEDST